MKCLGNLRPGFTHFALPLQRSTFFHLKARSADGSGDHRGGGEAAGIEVSVPGNFAFDDGFLRVEVAFDGSILSDCQAPF